LKRLRWVGLSLGAVAAVLLVTLAWFASDELSPRDVGLGVGVSAPPFALVDQSGETRTLESLLERGKLAIVFHRSADW